MTSTDIELAKAARKGSDEFEKVYVRKFGKTDGAILANKFSYYLNIDPNAKANDSSGNTNTGSSSSGAVGKITEGIGDIQSFSTKLTMGSKTDITDLKAFLGAGVETLNQYFGKNGGIIDGTTALIKKLGGAAFDGSKDILAKEVELRAQINSQLGVAGDLSKNYRQQIVDALPGVVSMGYGFEHVSDLMVGLAEETGRFTTLNSTVVADTAQTSRAFVGDLTEMSKVFSNFEQVGIGAEKTVEAINKAGKSSIALGLNGKKTVDEIRTNIAKLNEYGFQNGIQGLTRMVQKATEFRMSMNEVFTIADKVMDPEGAISLSANLQVLGGAIGDFGDPLKMMYDATNNVEGLQDALIGAAGSLAAYNSTSGQFEIQGINLRRAKAMAQELGISYQELAKGAIASAERASAASALMANGLKLDEKQTEFITNLARMKDGVMSIDVSSISKEFGGAQSIALDKLTEEQVRILNENQKKLEGMSIEDVARDQFTETQNLVLKTNEILTILKVQFAKSIGRPAGEAADVLVKEANKYLQGATKGEKGNKGAELISALKSEEGLAGIIKASASSKKQEALKVDNKPKETPKQDNTSNTDKPMTAAEFREIQNSGKYDKNKQIIINNNLEPLNPNDYLSLKI
jgi:hypothetical protein